MIGYNILEMDSMPKIIKNKPRWVTCAVFATGLLLIIFSAIAIGTVIGYTYCYFEHRSIIKQHKAGNISHSTNVQILHMPFIKSVEAKNRTINGALSNVLFSRFLKIGQAFMDEDLIQPPWNRDNLPLYRFY